jgi:hypothetical protein
MRKGTQRNFSTVFRCHATEFSDNFPSTFRRMNQNQKLHHRGSIQRPQGLQPTTLPLRHTNYSFEVRNVIRFVSTLFTFVNTVFFFVSTVLSFVKNVLTFVSTVCFFVSNLFTFVYTVFSSLVLC